MREVPILLDVKEAAALARVSLKQIRDLCAEGKIKAVKVGDVWRINATALVEQLGLSDQVHVV